MIFWNLGGMNPNYKEFVEKHPEKTLLGMAWSQYWRFFVIIIVVELILLALFALVAFGYT